RPPTLGVPGDGHRITVDDGLLAGVLASRLQPDDGTFHLMDVFRLHGPSRLTGAIDVRGAKNSVLKLMAASLLAVGRTTITNVPAILDVRIMVELLVRLGCEVDYDSADGVVSIDVPAEVGIQADYELVRAMRASISVHGPLTARMRAAHVALPGADAISSQIGRASCRDSVASPRTN